ncbi:uncharacterized protein TRUGW13939_05677 [Talaromyces rugulosus]|uniref:DNA2/NAM7 helicase helicase domain-containing protein n=1 Tax=Talaromyces rugulosus TaxID=121627 RepID=A0A7H8QWR5_TALRU|nr:uncharacterized protein TRUGW13939_05677 [Talaromyces rugulosus]QKX58552.1 hypothetical protein TRUGW13939_05677 [Talaromyces rugulosus]
MGFEDSTSVAGFYKISPDSQSPRITSSMTKDQLSPTVVFGLQNCTIEIDFEDENTDGAQKIKQLRDQYKPWFENIKNDAALSDALPENQSVTIIATWRKNWKQPTKLCHWLLMLQEKIKSNRQSLGQGSDKVPTCFWYYYQQMKKLEASDDEVNNNKNDQDACVPGYPWLAPPTEEEQHKPLIPFVPYFIDDHERYFRLGMAMKREREEQRKVIEDVFTFDRTHKATIRQVGQEYIHLQIIINSSYEELFKVPNINEGVKVDVETGDGFGLKFHGKTIDVPTDADLVVELKSLDVGDFLPDSDFEVKLNIKPNLTIVKNQIKAIKDASQKLVVGDTSETPGAGFSLLRTVLAHGSEVNTQDPNYFVLDTAKMSGLEEHVIRDRLAVLEKTFQLDDTKRQAYTSSVRTIVAGVSIIQGPPGTGKTHVAVAIVVTLASLGLKVLLAAGSNKAVDNVSTAIAKFFHKHPQLKQWCGILTRARTPTWQLSLLRANSGNSVSPKRSANGCRQDTAGVSNAINGAGLRQLE